MIGANHGGVNRLLPDDSHMRGSVTLGPCKKLALTCFLTCNLVRPSNHENVRILQCICFTSLPHCNNANTKRRFTAYWRSFAHLTRASYKMALPSRNYNSDGPRPREVRAGMLSNSRMPSVLCFVVPFSCARPILISSQNVLVLP